MIGEPAAAGRVADVDVGGAEVAAVVLVGVRTEATFRGEHPEHSDAAAVGTDVEALYCPFW